MNSEEIKEIKKALECCKQNEIEDTCEYCLDCPASDWDYEKECNIDLFQKTITLINDLESENEELKKYKTDWLNSEKMHLQSDMEDTEFELASSNRLFEIVSKENQTLKEHIAVLESENKSLQDLCNKTYEDLTKEIDRLEKVVKHYQELIEDGKLISSEQLKQFAERLKEQMNEGEYMGKKYKLSVFRDIDIDETLKEFLK